MVAAISTSESAKAQDWASKSDEIKNHIRLSRLQTPKPGGGEKASFSPPIPTSTHASYIPPRALTNFISRHKKTCCNFTVTLTLYFRIVPRLGRIFNQKIKEKKKKIMLRRHGERKLGLRFPSVSV
jgi:hypothetical protein